jgi:hypothetical protein
MARGGAVNKRSRGGARKNAGRGGKQAANAKRSAELEDIASGERLKNMFSPSGR